MGARTYRQKTYTEQGHVEYGRWGLLTLVPISYNITNVCVVLTFLSSMLRVGLLLGMLPFRGVIFLHV